MCLLRLFKICSNALKRNETGEDRGVNLGLIFFLGLLAGALIAVIESDLLEPLTEIKTTDRPPSQLKLHGIWNSNSTGSAQVNSLSKLENMQNLSTTWLSSKKQGTRILCWIMTTAKLHKTRASHIKTTWGKHCDVLLFMSDGDDDKLPAVNLNVSSNYFLLWGKTVAAFKYLHDKHANDYDWVLKADDDTFVCVENLKKMLLSLNSSEKLFSGHSLRLSAPEKIRTLYPHGGAGYILSKSGVQAFVEYHDKGNFNTSHCPPRSDNSVEDYNFGRCMAYLGVKFIDSRDSKGRHTMFPVSLDRGGMFPNNLGSNQWVFNLSFNHVANVARDTFSPRHISQHYVTSYMMYLNYYLLNAIKHPIPVEHIIPMKQNTSSADIVKYPVNYAIIAN